MKRRKMNDYWWTNVCLTWRILVFIGIFLLNSIFCWSLNHEGISLLKFKERLVNDPFGGLSSWNEENGEVNPCSWFGVGCASGQVVSLNLTNLCLEGTLAPELHHLLHIKSIILRNNSFSGLIPGEIRNLKELKLLDLSFNNFREPITHESGSNIPIFILEKNGLSCHVSSEVHEEENLSIKSLKVLSYFRHNDQAKDVRHSRILQDANRTQASEISPPDGTDSTSGGGSAKSLDDLVTNSPPKPPLTPPPSPLHNLPPQLPEPQPPPPPPPPDSPLSPPSPSRAGGLSGKDKLLIGFGTGGGIIGLVLISFLLYFLRGSKIKKVTRFSGQLKKAFVPGNDRSDGVNIDKPSFVEGVPNLKWSELQTACEDFSNVIGSSSIGTIYKGTLSNGVEIAVISLCVTSAKDWSRNLETQFRKKIETLSKVNHKNFVNLIGYCEEEEPFARLMIFEYAPNGSLFEHLHVREAEHLDWGMRLRVAMGMSYCLEHMHQLTPPVTHPNLNSSAVNLSEDYAAKISDFCFWNEVAAAPRVQPVANGMSGLSTISVSPKSNVYNFGLLLLEMMTGRIPHSLENNSIDHWVSEYLSGEQPLEELIDPMLRQFKPEQLNNISEVIRKCLHSEQHRPTMKDVTARLREITGVAQDKAVPRFSSLWWAELDARSVNGT
ncbi:probable inactive receptor-like protein kinase At3g56050 [Beta vulgaris subsp. vulgaris]|uniref:probable inactive receptor-like protein kinase At3g56050 n=1 Tax=Beta vulgaris subsp. vulgaris TaxID=3555 RepID=UPI00254799C6|nr:probable inactive receptor-like protein kinase At3g56050 [Beta vulgaris subsp. vulgaris]